MAINPNTITSANSVFKLTATGLYTTAQTIQGYAVDAAFMFDDVETAETQMGVDGIMSGGWIPAIYPQTVSLQANSVSVPIFEGIWQAQAYSQELLTLTATIQLPAIRRIWTFPQGYSKGLAPVPEAKKTLGMRKFKIDWANVTVASY